MKDLNGPKGLGGWLILPIIGLCITPIRLGLMLLNDYLPIFTTETWGVVNNPESDIYHPMLGPLIVFELLGNIFFIVCSVILLVLLFRKHWLTPKLMIVFYVTNLIFVVLDTVVGGTIPVIAEQGLDESYQEVSRTVVSSLIWIPYFCVSKRVKNTFVKEGEAVLESEAAPVEEDAPGGEE